MRERSTGKLYAVKKAKERYLGYKDREQKLQEVYKAWKLTEENPSQLETSSGIDDAFYRAHCLKVHEAWEESGYLYIKSELCEKGNLNDYLME